MGKIKSKKNALPKHNPLFQDVEAANSGLKSTKTRQKKKKSDETPEGEAVITKYMQFI